MTQPSSLEKTIMEYRCSISEEIANSITHGFGVILSVAGLTMLVTSVIWQDDIRRIIGFSVYGISLVLLFLISTLYHSFQGYRIKEVLKLLDHCAIYLLIAGTYTPFLLISLWGTVGWVFLSIIWLLALSGIVFKVVFFNRFRKLSVIIYILMGWLVVVVSEELLAKISIAGMIWLVAGGLTYTAGVIFYVWNRLPFSHAIWHIFVLGGGMCHFCSIYLYI